MRLPRWNVWVVVPFFFRGVSRSMREPDASPRCPTALTESEEVFFKVIFPPLFTALSPSPPDQVGEGASFSSDLLTSSLARFSAPPLGVYVNSTFLLSLFMVQGLPRTGYKILTRLLCVGKLAPAIRTSFPLRFFFRIPPTPGMKLPCRSYISRMLKIAPPCRLSNEIFLPFPLLVLFFSRFPDSVHGWSVSGAKDYSCARRSGPFSSCPQLG